MSPRQCWKFSCCKQGRKSHCDVTFEARVYRALQGGGEKLNLADKIFLLLHSKCQVLWFFLVGQSLIPKETELTIELTIEHVQMGFQESRCLAKNGLRLPEAVTS